MTNHEGVWILLNSKRCFKRARRHVVLGDPDTVFLSESAQYGLFTDFQLPVSVYLICSRYQRRMTIWINSDLRFVTLNGCSSGAR